MRKIFILLLALFCLSCSHKKEARKAVEDFIASWKKSDEEMMKKIYPNLKNFTSFYKSDEATITKIKSWEIENVYEVTVHNKYTNGFGKSSENDIIFYARPKAHDKLNEYIIADSKGLWSYFEDESAGKYRFARAIGAIKEKDLTDMRIVKGIEKAEPLLNKKIAQLIGYFRKEVGVSKVNWQIGNDGNSAIGNARCINKTPYDIPNLQYEVCFFRNGEYFLKNEIGNVSYNYSPLKAGQSASFSFFSNDTGHANQIGCRLRFDKQFLINIVANQHYEGNEFRTTDSVDMTYEETMNYTTGLIE